MKNRKKLLINIIKLENNSERSKRELKNYPWDSQEIIHLTKMHIKAILEKYIKLEINNHEIENWADFLEGRDDVGFDENDFEKIKEIISELANPDLFGKLTKDKVIKYLNELEL